VTVSWTVIVPVKRLETAKTRLRGALGIPLLGVPEPAAPVARQHHHGETLSRQRNHEALVLAMALDTIAAALGSPVVGRVVVVTTDEAAGSEASLMGAEVVPDVPESGLNPALAYAAAEARRGGTGIDPGVAAIAADLPALRSEELTEALRHADAAARESGPLGLARSFVADAAGTGTVLLAAPPGAVLEPCFGAGSAAAHRASGAVPLAGAWPGLRRDVDTPADLAEAFVLGVGPRTATAAHMSHEPQLPPSSAEMVA
jgi:2-phospho-L-lactate guanylyltransferase